MHRFEPGLTIELREVWRGETWEERTAIVVQDEPDLIALYTPRASHAMIAVDADGNHLRMPTKEWTLRRSTAPALEILALHVPGAEHSLLAIFDPPPRFTPWYINLESDLVRTERGFEYEEHVLDVLVERDLSTWRWKDEDELEEAVALGMFTPRQAEAFRHEGLHALNWLLTRQPPYDRDWLSWRPPPEWLARA